MGISRVGDDLGDADLALGLVGSILQNGGRGEALVRHIIAHPAEDIRSVGGGIDARNIEFRESFHEAENRLKLGLESGHFRIAEFEAGEIGDVADIDVAVRHGRSVLKRRGFSKCQVRGMKMRLDKNLKSF